MTSSLPFQRNAFALACGLALVTLSGAAQAQTENSVLAQWREYARRGVMPEYSWSEEDSMSVAPTLLGGLRGSVDLLGTSSLAAVGFTGQRLGLGFGSAAVGDNSRQAAAPSRSMLDFDAARNVIRNDFVASTYEQALGRQGRFGVTAIVARQRYASDGLGTTPWTASEDVVGVRGIDGHRPQELSTGHGVRVGYWSPLATSFAWSLSAQSRLEMDAFESFRGMYSEAGDFDVPGRVEARLSWAPTSRAALSLGVDRVYYSDITAFTSAALPRRFLALLGDGGAPQFAWRDLTVYSMEGTVADPWDGRWTLRYTTSQQPTPTSELLAYALSLESSSRNITLGYRRDIAGLGDIAFNASYSSDPYFLGATPYELRDLGAGAQVEVEAVFSVRF